MPSHRLRLAATILTGACAVVAVLPATAAAATPTAHPTRHHHGVDYAGTNVWGGYVAQGSNFRSISGSWTMPQVTCNTTTDLFAPWVGIDGYGSTTVEQTGVQVDCSTGSPVLSAWYEMYPADPVFWNDTVKTGDNLTGSVTTDGTGTYTITLTDNTAGWTESTQQQLNAQNVSAEAVMESPSNSYPSFNELDFTGVTVNGQVFDTYAPQAIDSGSYTETALSNGSFAIVPSTTPLAAATTATAPTASRPAVIRY